MERAEIERLAEGLGKLSEDDRKKFFNTILKWNPPPRLSKYCPQTLSPKQSAFLSAPQEEILFGGSAGGGKTASLIIAALQYADQPKYDALIIRRTLKELEMPGSSIALSKQWLTGTDATWRAQKNQWIFPAGATLTFNYLDRDDDKWQYNSSNFNYIAFDEAAEFPQEETYLFLFSRLRRGAGETIPGRMRLAANPIGPGAGWLKRRFITTKDPTRLYLPSRLDDNPYIDRDDYRKSLAKLPTHVRLALENGDWDAKPPGKMFQSFWFRSVKASPAEAIRVRFWDLAATAEDKHKNPSWTCGLLLAYADGVFYIEDIVRRRETPGTVKEIVKETALKDGVDTEVWIEQEGGSSGVFVIEDYIKALPRFAVRPLRVTGPKESRAAPVASQAEAKNLRILEAEWNEAFLEEISQFPDTRIKNDQVDALSGAYTVLANHIQNYGDDLGISLGGGTRVNFDELV